MFWLIPKVLEITVKDGQRLQGKQSMYNEFPKIKFIQRQKVYPYLLIEHIFQLNIRQGYEYNYKDMNVKSIL